MKTGSDMKYAACFDTETTGFSPENDACIEVACVLFSIEHAAPVRTFATLIHAKSNAAEHINRIPAALLADALAPDVAWKHVFDIFKRADCILAHNAPFDRRFTPPMPFERPWIDTWRDIEYPEQSSNKTLATIALAHGVPVLGAHRAMADVDIMVRILQRLTEKGHDVSALLTSASEPKVLVQALVSYEQKDLAKQAGFEWKAAPLKRWEKRIAPSAAKKLPFKVRAIPDTPSV